MNYRMIAIAVLAMACSAYSEVKLASVFSDHMVLQRDKAVNVWGTTDPGKTVTVKIGDHSKTTKADSSGKWIVHLDKHKASQTPVTMTVTEAGGNTISISDVLFGDVWICSGQSNMEFQLFKANNAAEALPAAKDEQLRLLRVPRVASEKPLSEQDGKWTLCSPQTARTFSAVGYFFGKEIREREHVPVGLIGAYWSSTAAESWTPAKYLNGDKWKPLLEHDHELLAEYPEKHQKWEEKMKTLPPGKRKPAEPLGPTNSHLSSVLWNGMINPLIPTTFEGVIWYQGERNASRAQEYRTLFPLLIKAWRTEFGEGKFPFLFVQLAGYGKNRGDSDKGSEWAELREAQTLALKLPNTGMAVAIDIGSADSIHPTDKQTVGRRLALSAEKVAYGQNVESVGPTFKSMKIEGNKIKITFTHAQGLMAKGGVVKGFTIASKDQKFVPAQTTIQGNAVIVSAENIQQPVAVRYAWAQYPDVTLYNSAGLPAVPFRTDNWPEVTAGQW
ncbi:MAG TPA: sialate O-acetylesterase [Tepidisphaeraceae bacterium]|nr:sialate O-acetylesterase [Tepidisphaeraceae bacterium]